MKKTARKPLEEGEYMNAIRLLAKLTAKGVAIGGVGGGTIEVSRADVAAAISFAGVSMTADRLIRFLYCQDEAQEALLLAALVHELRRRVPMERFMLHRMARLALHELAARPICCSCNGQGTVAARMCQPCGGSGMKALPQRERAAMLELAQTTFRRNYEDASDQVYQHIAMMANDALARLSAQFSEQAA